MKWIKAQGASDKSRELHNAFWEMVNKINVYDGEVIELESIIESGEPLTEDVKKALEKRIEQLWSVFDQSYMAAEKGEHILDEIEKFLIDVRTRLGDLRYKLRTAK